MRISDFDFYSEILANECGLALSEQKSFLLDSRLLPVARKWGYFSPAAMILALRGVPDAALVRDVVGAMMSHETSFYRDGAPFDRLGSALLPALMRHEGRRSRRHIRIWSAGCATGEEAYSLALAARDAPGLSGWIIDVLGSDIAEDALAKAREGVYPTFAAQGVPAAKMLSGFDRTEDGKWSIKPDIRRMVSFSAFNLLHDMEKLGSFDIIFCRYVLGQMTANARASILMRMAPRLAPDGFLILAPHEQPPAEMETYRPAGLFPGLYVPTGSPHNFPNAAPRG